ncbi:DUF2470 domain-containing protein [Mycobacterium sp. CBMA293]|uniref:DUF2470 domain-containing protein n=1 Tax=unclassified Mycolicibacterium TaxID=2636767 RepID=UPI0012DCC85B|nr:MULTISPECIES: DUF2470 domain-containing protein [unclassified Mycolicibacterium]MUL46565.1 DUF2470 domain-containing protein [Mycolicibacterium sp. CBMA 360]MUL59136.1 DUF2470 domain-containing protein [Mycolicibacterium sp. CBMA 335]MUL69530.1 DUF2470 domain-containing protein [Mycolicibacterium sp. CBMA 311]MUL94494.1 DUF2470 domain-containing protein [Mycolicibacterium sp. CBMA 230]MUM06489.1 DUF2470 domain-containing protein [Mycolicibacterium sp. CBMA 213]
MGNLTTTIAAPTTAERVRSACARAADAMLAADGVTPATTPVHHLLADGSVALTVPDGLLAATVTAAGAGGVAAMLELTDLAALPLRERVRSLVWFRGRLRAVHAAYVPALLDLIAAENPHPALLQVNPHATDNDLIDPTDPPHVLLRLEIESVVVADATGAEAVDVGTLLDARPDPFCAMESHWVQHLESAHRDLVDRLANRLPMTLRQGHVRPLGVDRYGVQLRIEREDGDHDVRLPFTQPVDDVTSLSRAIRALLGCPFLNGLRARKI